MIQFDVNDADLRELFLRHGVLPPLGALTDATPPRWGGMNARQMVEHLLWTFELSTGQSFATCEVTLALLPRVLRFLYSNHPTPRDFENPVLRDGLPPLRYTTLLEAKAALGREMFRFLDGPRHEDPWRVHPMFGPISYDGWHRAHYKHAYHHLLQFGLVDPPLMPRLSQ